MLYVISNDAFERGISAFPDGEDRFGCAPVRMVDPPKNCWVFRYHIPSN
jgi:hypothetical protein